MPKEIATTGFFASFWPKPKKKKCLKATAFELKSTQHHTTTAIAELTLIPKEIATTGFLALLAVTKKGASLKAPALRKKANQSTTTAIAE